MSQHNKPKKLHSTFYRHEENRSGQSSPKANEAATVSSLKEGRNALEVLMKPIQAPAPSAKITQQQAWNVGGNKEVSKPGIGLASNNMVEGPGTVQLPKQQPVSGKNSPVGGNTPKGTQSPKSGSQTPTPDSKPLVAGMPYTRIILIDSCPYGESHDGGDLVRLSNDEKDKYFSFLAMRQSEEDQAHQSYSEEDSASNNFYFAEDKGGKKKGGKEGKKESSKKKMVHVSELKPVLDVPKDKLLGVKVVVPYTASELPTFKTESFTKKFKNLYANLDTNDDLRHMFEEGRSTPASHEHPFEDDLGL